MAISDGEDGGHDTRFSGTATGRVQVGRYILDVPSPGGTTLSLAPRRMRSDPPPELEQALAKDIPETAPARGFAERANQALDTAEEVTDQIERATATVKAVLEGRVPDAELISEYVTDWFALLERLNQAGRFEEVIKLGRPLCRLLTLTLRWAMLVETLRLVFHAAAALADTGASAWAEHELGTLHGADNQVDRARELLNQARRIRAANGDERGLAATDHNLRVLRRRPAFVSSKAVLASVGVVALVVAGLILAETVSGGSSDGQVATSTTASTRHSSATRSKRHSRTTTSRSSNTSHTTNSQHGGNPPAAAVDPSTIPFAPTSIGKTQRGGVELLNKGPGPLRVTSAPTLVGASAFAIAVDTCGGQILTAGASCAVTVEFTPTAAGEVTATLTFTDNADPGTQQVPLSGTGEPSSITTTVKSTPTTSTPATSTAPTTTQAPIQ
jgi:hypothetical protein